MTSDAITRRPEMTSMAHYVKPFVGLVAFLAASVWYQGTYSLTAQDSVAILSSSNFARELEETGRIENRTFVRKDEFWLTETDTAILPFEVAFVPPDEAWGQVEPIWECNDNSTRNKKLVFVNIVRTEGLVVQELLAQYASSCHVGLASVVVCSGLSWDSMKDVWSTRRARGSTITIKCPLQGDSVFRNGKSISKRYASAGLLKESIDMVAGQVPMGSHEQWKNEQNKIVDAQYIVSLCSPLHWFVSSTMDKVKIQNEGGQVDPEVYIDAIKEKVEFDLAKDTYHEVYARYLITPAQIAWIQKEEAELGIEHRVDLSLTNLKNSSAIIVISEQQSESLELLEYLIDSGGHQKVAFAKARRQIVNTEGESPSLSKVLESLKEDTEFYPRLEKYLKYETKIYEQAKEMHKKQMQWLRKNRPTYLP